MILLRKIFLDTANKKFPHHLKYYKKILICKTLTLVLVESFNDGNKWEEIQNKNDHFLLTVNNN